MVVFNGEQERAIEAEKKFQEWFKTLPKDSPVRQAFKNMINADYGMLDYKREDKKNG